MAIYGQPNSWTCGPFALKHALLAFGVFAPEDELSALAGSTEERGTDEVQLARAARAYETRLRLVRETATTAARGELEAWLGRHVPVLLCLDQWEHWVTAVGADSDHVIIFDSKYDAPLRAESWEPLLDRLACRRRYFQGTWTRTLFDLHPVVPRRPAGFRLALNAPRAQHLLREENARLAQRWDEYARALLPLALAPGPQLELGADLERFIHARRAPILDLAVNGGGDAARARAAHIVDGLAFVAGMYGATLRPEVEPEAVARLSAIAAQFLSVDSGPPASLATSAAA